MFWLGGTPARTLHVSPVPLIARALRRAALVPHCQPQHCYLTSSVHNVVLQKSIPTQICQPVLYCYQFEE